MNSQPPTPTLTVLLFSCKLLRFPVPPLVSGLKQHRAQGQLHCAEVKVSFSLEALEEPDCSSSQRARTPEWCPETSSDNGARKPVRTAAVSRGHRHYSICAAPRFLWGSGTSGGGRDPGASLGSGLQFFLSSRDSRGWTRHRALASGHQGLRFGCSRHSAWQ